MTHELPTRAEAVGRARRWFSVVPVCLALLPMIPSGVDGQVVEESTAAAVEPTSAAAGADDVDLGPLAGRPRISPTRTDTPPEIDGRLDDEVWRTATKITELVQQSPIEGDPATEATDIYLAYDENQIYFGFYAHYRDPSIMRSNRVDRDRASADDLMTIYFDTFMDQQQGYDFDVNGYGVQGDGIISRTGGRGPIPFADRTFDALFETAGQIVEDGYIAEMAIPFKSLRYPKPSEGQPHRWGFQIVREVKDNQENQVWAPMSRDESSFLGQMGVLEGMTDLSTSRNIEIMPTFTAIQYGAIDPTVPGFVNQDPDPDAGVNLKYGITSNLTADLTVNPDFSQIESDRAQIEVNQRFPLFFGELRPFFLEGSEIFRIQAPVTLVHTRTIVNPDYGAKLSGKVGPVSLGLLAANDRAPGNVGDVNDPLFDQTAYTFIGRALYEVYAESTIGGMITDREFIDSHSRMFDLDGNLRLNASTVFRFRAVQTLHKGLGAETEEESGNMLTARFVGSGRHVDWDLFLYQISPDLDTDVGFVRRTDVRQASTALGYRFWPESWLINWGPRVTYMRSYTFDDVLQDERLGVSTEFQFARNINFSGTYNRDMERFLGTDFRKNRFSVRARASTSRTYQFNASFSTGDQVRYSATPFLGYGTNWGVGATLRPISRVQVSLNLNTSRLTDPRDDSEVFDVKILRARTDIQFTDRIALRNIVEFNDFNKTFDFNVLLNYRVNAGTVFYVGYDDHYRRASLISGDQDEDGIPDQLFFADDLRRTNRAIFVKFQYLLRY